MRRIIIPLLLLLLSSPVLPQLNPGVIGNDQTICYQSAPVRLFFVTPSSGGNPPYSFRWERSNDGGSTWAEIIGTNGGRDNYSPPVLARNAWFRCRVTDIALNVATTNFVSIIVSSNLQAGTIGNAQTIYSGTVPAPLTQLSAPSGATGTYSFRWQSSTDGVNWSDIVGATNSNYAPSAMTSTLWFRRWVIDTNCGSKSSNTIRIFVLNSITIHTSEIPVIPGENYGVQFDLGTKFEVLSSGIITKARLFGSVNDLGLHQIRLWKLNDQSIFELIAGPIDWYISAGPAGWKEFALPSPVIAEANQVYMISITTGNNYFAISPEFSPVSPNVYLRFTGGNSTSLIGSVPSTTIAGPMDSYFRDVVFVPFSAGNAGVSDEICYNTSPGNLAQISAPSGGFGSPYSIQWQNSTNGVNWTNIESANMANYTPPALTVSTFYRRVVTSSGLSVNGPQILIKVDTPFNGAQLQNNITINENSSTFFKVALSGGTPPYTVIYERNGVPQAPITGYISGTDIFTGILSSGLYEYRLTSVIDAFGCSPQSLGNNIIISATLSGSAQANRKAIVIINTNNIYYHNFDTYIRPYLDWFGIPYDTCDIDSQTLPTLTDYAIIILGHQDVFGSFYPIAELESAVFNGAGLCSFDQHLFDYPSGFNTLSSLPYPDVESSIININSGHYISQYHANDEFHATNSTINLKFFPPDLQTTITIGASVYALNNAINIATMSDGTNTAPLLQAGTYGTGKVVRWSNCRWMEESYLGPIYGMDDLVWRGIVWASRKPFIMQGIPPMVTMRVDDVTGQRSQLMLDLEWLNICNEYGLIPWLGILTNEMSELVIDTLRDRIDNNLATAAPHAFGYDDFIFYNLNGSDGFNSTSNIQTAWDFFTINDLKMSNYILPHWYLFDPDAPAALAAVGVEIIGNIITERGYPFTEIDYPGPWLQGGPYRIDREGTGNRQQAHFYAGNITLAGQTFFNCLSEIGDDGGYEWFPDGSDIPGTISRGVRHLRRSLNGMFLPVLFTHEDQIVMEGTNWRTILDGVTDAISSYAPEYRSLDYAVQYLRAKENIEINNVTDLTAIVNISCSGVNDMETKCYLFTETENQITQRLVTLPIVTSSTVPVTVAVLK